MSAPKIPEGLVERARDVANRRAALALGYTGHGGHPDGGRELAAETFPWPTFTARRARTHRPIPQTVGGIVVFDGDGLRYATYEGAGLTPVTPTAHPRVIEAAQQLLLAFPVEEEYEVRWSVAKGIASTHLVNAFGCFCTNQTVCDRCQEYSLQPGR